MSTLADKFVLNWDSNDTLLFWLHFEGEAYATRIRFNTKRIYSYAKADKFLLNRARKETTAA